MKRRSNVWESSLVISAVGNSELTPSQRFSALMITAVKEIANAEQLERLRFAKMSRLESEKLFQNWIDKYSVIE